MSIAVAAPEKTESTPAAEVAKHPGAVVIDLDNLSKKPEAKAPEKTAEKSPENAPAADEAAKADELKAAEAKAAETAKSADKSKGGDKEQNMAALRTAREAAEAAAKAASEERDRFKAELEELRSKAPELPEDVRGRLSKMEALEKEREELRLNLRQADLARDPEFQEKYAKGIGHKIGTMGEIAMAAGIPQEDWKRAVANWNEEQFAEWQDGMSASQKVKFNAAWIGATELYQQQQADLANADKTYTELQKQRQAAAEDQRKQYLGQNEKLAMDTLAEVLKPVSVDDYPDVPEAAKVAVMKAARHEMTPQDIFKQLAANQVLARVVPKQQARIDELVAQLAERDKKIAEQEEFIGKQSSAVPRGDAAGTTSAVDDKTPIWKQIVVKAP